METLHIQQTNTCPLVEFNPNGNLLLAGIATPENVQKFFAPVFVWIDSYLSTNPSKTNFRIHIEYLNTSSTRIMIDLIKRIHDSKTDKHKVTIEWVYEDGDEDIMELGEDIAAITKCNLVLVAI